jgi:integrase
MASIHKRGSTYVVRYRVNGTNAGKTFKSHREAQVFKADVETQIHRGRAVDPKHAKQTYRQWHESWMANRLDIRDSTRGRVQQIARTHLFPTFGNLPVQDIRQQTIQAWIAQLDMAPATVRRCYGELDSSLKTAVAAGIIYDTPCKGIRLPKMTQARMTILDHSEVAGLARHIGPRYSALVFVLAYAGLRIGEACDLTPADVDPALSLIHVNSTVTKDAEGHRTVGVPKSAAGIRSVPVPRAIMDRLVEHMNTYPGDFVFTGARGKPLHPRNFSQRTFKQSQERYNVERQGAGLPAIHCRVHDLRHTAVTQWIRTGVDLPRLKTWAGHTNAAFTLNRYAHYFPKDDHKFMDLLDAGISGA